MKKYITLASLIFLIAGIIFFGTGINYHRTSIIYLETASNWSKAGNTAFSNMSIALANSYASISNVNIMMGLAFIFIALGKTIHTVRRIRRNTDD